MPKAQAARTFRVSLSSVKRYVDKANRGKSLAPKKRPGAVPKLDEKAMRLLAADLEGRPYLTLQERCDYVEAMTGLSVSRSTMCRAIARIGPTRKKGGDQPPSATRVLKGERAGDGGGEGGEPERLVFVDECVLGTPPWRRSTATRPKGERLRQDEEPPSQGVGQDQGGPCRSDRRGASGGQCQRRPRFLRACWVLSNRSLAVKPAVTTHTKRLSVSEVSLYETLHNRQHNMPTKLINMCLGGRLCQR